MLKSLAGVSLFLLVGFVLVAQEAVPTAPKQPLVHVIGAVTAVDAGSKTVNVKEDKTGTDFVIQLANTKTLLKVEPGAKDLKTAVRITSDDLQVGDRVDVRAIPPDDAGKTVAAKSIILMSARSLQQAHQEQAAAWQKATAGVVSEVDPASGKVTINTRTPGGPKPVVLETTKATEFTRYSPDNPKQPAPSQLADIRAGDQVRVIGGKSDDGATITAERVYSGAFRTISATISAIGADGKSVTVKDLSNKKPVEIALNDDSAVRRLPPMMANMLARRFNPSYKPAEGTAPAGAGGVPQGAAKPAQGGQTPTGGWASRPQGNSAAGGGGGGWQSGGSGGRVLVAACAMAISRSSWNAFLKSAWPN